MITDTLSVDRSDFEEATGWELKPEGACLGDICIPLSGEVSDTLNVADVAAQLGLPLVHDEPSGLWAVGPHSIQGRTLVSAEAPALKLPDLDGNEFDLASLRGKKVLLWAWAPY